MSNTCIGITIVKQECIPVGCIPPAAVAMSISACTGHCVSQHALGRGCVYPSIPAQGVSVGGVYPSMHWGRHPLWAEWLTDRCKDITFPQPRLQTVKMTKFSLGFKHRSIPSMRYDLYGMDFWDQSWVQHQLSSWWPPWQANPLSHLIFQVETGCHYIVVPRSTELPRPLCHGEWKVV